MVGHQGVGLLSAESDFELAVQVRSARSLTGMSFLDTLSLLFADDSWQIYHKLFHVEGPVDG